MNPHDHIDDAEFEDFLKGEGDLARQLQGLAQPQVPDALSAAILGRAAADMGDGAQPGVSANEAVHDGAPVTSPQRHYLRRARVPLGLAASVALALFVARGLLPQAVAPNRAEVATVVAIAEPVPPPSTPPPAVAATASVVAAKPATAKRSAAPSVVAPVPMADIMVAAAPAAESSLAMRSAPPPAPPAPQAPAPIPANAALPGPDVTFARATLSAPVLLAPVIPAPAWLARMADMLKAGQTKEAHAEWLKFRMRYPDTEVPPELQRQLDTVN